MPQADRHKRNVRLSGHRPAHVHRAQPSSRASRRRTTHLASRMPTMHGHPACALCTCHSGCAGRSCHSGDVQGALGPAHEALRTTRRRGRGECLHSRVPAKPSQCGIQALVPQNGGRAAPPPHHSRGSATPSLARLRHHSGRAAPPPQRSRSSATTAFARFRHHSGRSRLRRRGVELELRRGERVIDDERDGIRGIRAPTRS